jgi:sugar phosphate isomerase/epimerase
MSASLGLQLYSVREELSGDFEGVVRKIAALGFAGVEPAGFPNTTPEAAGKLFRSLGLEVPSAHVPLPLGDQQKSTLETLASLGSKRIVSGLGPDSFKTLDLIKQTCGTFNQAQAVAKAHGMTFGIHNHWWEFIEVEGRMVFEVMKEHLEPDVFFQIDTYWVKTAGADPAAIVHGLGPRAPLLHIKDGPCVKDKPMTAVGDGVVDVPAIARAAGTHAKWFIVEIDRCKGDMLAAVAKSYRYLVANRLARGRRPTA